MPLVHVDSAEQARAALAAYDATVVVVPVYNSPDDVARCIASLLAHTDPRHPILVVDDASPDPQATAAVRAIDASSPHTVLLLRNRTNLGFVGTCNAAFDITGRNDVVLVNSDVEVAAEWLDRMVAAAASSNTVATVSVFTNHGTILSLPQRNVQGPMPDGVSLAEAARRIADVSQRTYPVLPTGVGHCLLVRRAALDAVGGFDPVFAPGYGEEVDFSQRALAAGFLHVLADDVFVYHKGGSSFGLSPEKLAMQAAHEAILNERYRYYPIAVQHAAESNHTVFADALARARRALVGRRVAVDGMCLGKLLMGTQRFTLETAAALADRPDIESLHLFVPSEVPAYVQQVADEHPALVVHPIDGYEPQLDHFDAVVRPFQVDHLTQLRWMRDLADVIVVTQLDFIAYHNATYFKSPTAWRTYRDITALTFDTADAVAFISEHSRTEARREGLLSPHTHSAVTYCGLDHRSAAEVSVAPSATPAIVPGFLLMLGASYHHKNRLYALELWRLLRDGGFTGQLVFAGPTPPYGNSLDAEREWLQQHPALAAHLVQLPSIADPEKAWLLEHAGLLLYPTISEGFGMVPFEAAHSGTPSLTTRQGALDEVLPAALECLADLVPAHGVALAQRLLGDEAFRTAQVEVLRAAADGYTWADSVSSLVALVERALEAPAGRRAFGVPDSLRSQGGSVVDIAASVVRKLPGVHGVLIGEGTRRQRFIRSLVNRIRHRQV